jgi:hypothetical protein
MTAPSSIARGSKDGLTESSVFLGRIPWVNFEMPFEFIWRL